MVDKVKNRIGDARRSYAMVRLDGKFTQEDAAKEFGVSLGSGLTPKIQSNPNVRKFIACVPRRSWRDNSVVDVLVRKTGAGHCAIDKQ